MKYLIKFERNWCDEINCEQFVIIEDDPEAFIANTINETDYHSIGSNQEFEPGEITRDNFTVEMLTDISASVIKEHFSSQWGFGVGVM